MLEANAVLPRVEEAEQAGQAAERGAHPHGAALLLTYACVSVPPGNSILIQQPILKVLISSLPFHF